MSSVVIDQAPSHEVSELHSCAQEKEPPTKALLCDLLREDGPFPLESVLQAASIPRRKYYSTKVRLHILNNVRNGHCSEDCSYCAQRKTRDAEIPAYPEKSDEEILAEAKRAAKSGAFRYCMVTSGRGLTKASTSRYAALITKIKELYPLEVCLSAGLVQEPAFAKQLKAAGLDRYNHNLNTGEDTYDKICTTHSYQDRMQTLSVMQGAGLSLCSGIIAGMGESDEELAELALTLRAKQVPSIPINFFLPVPGHAVQETEVLTPDRCLRILAAFRLANPSSEIRMAAGRERYLGKRQAEALEVADSLFVSGYLNVEGSDLKETLAVIYGAGFEIDVKKSDLSGELQEVLDGLSVQKVDPFEGGHKDFSESTGLNELSAGAAVQMKDESSLRPFRKK